MLRFMNFTRNWPCGYKELRDDLELDKIIQSINSLKYVYIVRNTLTRAGPIPWCRAGVASTPLIVLNPTRSSMSRCPWCLTLHAPPLSQNMGFTLTLWTAQVSSLHNALYTFYVDHIFMLPGLAAGSKGVCYGDIGGPLVTKALGVDAGYSLVGITSYDCKSLVF